MWFMDKTHTYIHSVQYRAQHTSFLEILAKLLVERGCNQYQGPDGMSDFVDLGLAHGWKPEAYFWGKKPAMWASPRVTARILGLKEQWVPILGGLCVYCFHLFIQQTVTGHQLWSKHCVECWDTEIQCYEACLGRTSSLIGRKTLRYHCRTGQHQL